MCRIPVHDGEYARDAGFGVRDQVRGRREPGAEDQGLGADAPAARPARRTARSATNTRSRRFTSTPAGSTFSIASARSAGRNTASAATATRTPCSSSASCASPACSSSGAPATASRPSIASPGGSPITIWAGHWFHRRLMARSLRPVCQISYRPDGAGRAAPGWAGAADARCRPAGDADRRRRGSSADPGDEVLEGRLVLELKYHARVPALFRRLIEDFALAPETASKYRLGMAPAGWTTGWTVPRRRGGAATLRMPDFLTNAVPSAARRRPRRPDQARDRDDRRRRGHADLPVHARGRRDRAVVHGHAGPALDSDRDGDAGHRRQHRPRVQPGRGALDRPVPHRRARYAGHRLRHLRGRRGHGGRRGTSGAGG